MAGERIIAPNAMAFAGGRVIASPFQFYLDGNDNIRVEGWNTCAGATLEVQGRAINELGETQAFNMVLPLTADRVRNRRDFAPVRGYILNLVVVALDAEPCIGQTFARVTIIRGLSGATIVLGVLLQGYVTSQQGLGWPGSPIEHSFAAGGYIRTIAGTTPGAGADISETVPAGARWELVRLYSWLTTSVVVGDRTVTIALSSPAITTFRSSATNSQPGAFVRNYTWGQNLPPHIDNTNLAQDSSLPALTFLLAGERFTTAINNRNAGDQWGQVNYVVREWLEIE